MYVIGDYAYCTEIAKKILEKEPFSKRAQTIFYECNRGMFDPSKKNELDDLNKKLEEIQKFIAKDKSKCYR